MILSGSSVGGAGVGPTTSKEFAKVAGDPCVSPTHAIPAAKYWILGAD